jgi:hypothetical protein
VSTVDGSDVWSFVTGGLHAAEPVLSEVEGEDPVLYTIEVRILILERERVPNFDIHYFLTLVLTN